MWCNWIKRKSPRPWGRTSWMCVQEQIREKQGILNCKCKGQLRRDSMLLMLDHLRHFIQGAHWNLSDLHPDHVPTVWWSSLSSIHVPSKWKRLSLLLLWGMNFKCISFVFRKAAAFPFLASHSSLETRFPMEAFQPDALRPFLKSKPKLQSGAGSKQHLWPTLVHQHLQRWET